MSKTSSRLGRPGSKNFSSRMDPQGNRSCMLRIGERLMRAGSEGNLAQRPFLTQSQNQNKASGLGQGPDGTTKVDSSVEDTVLEPAGKYCSEDPGTPSLAPCSSALSCESEPASTRHANNNLLPDPGGPPASPATRPRNQSVASQHSQVARKKEVFLDHLRQKYPDHADIILGHHEEKMWGPVAPEGRCDADMSDGDWQTVPFSRGCRSRSSLPVGRSGNQDQEPLGVLYLQYGDQTKQVHVPTEISRDQDLHDLFLAAFPQQLTANMLKSPNMAVYIKDARRNLYFHLEDVRNITSRSCLKVYHKDPSHVFNRHARPAAAEGRVAYGSHSPVHTLSSPGRAALQSSMSPPMVRSMPSSPSRLAYSGRSSPGLAAGADAGSTALLRDRLSGTGRSGSLSGSSAILERRDVKPDEDVNNNKKKKTTALVLRAEGGLHYPESLSSLASCPSSSSSSLAADVQDCGLSGLSGVSAGLQQYHASIRPLPGHADTLEQQTQSSHRQRGNRKYVDSQLPAFTSQTPPPSPQRVKEVKTANQIIGGLGLVSADKMASRRPPSRRESEGVAMETMSRRRGSGSSSSSSSVFLDFGPAPPEPLGHMTAFHAQSERLRAMEEQISSLAGMVQHVLSTGDKNTFVSESREKSPAVAMSDRIGSASVARQAPPTESKAQQSLAQLRRSVCDLRLQLTHLRHLQVSQQQSTRSMLRMAEQELVLLMSERWSQTEDRTCGPRVQMEEERLHYLATEESILQQLSHLEAYVSRLQTSGVSFPAHVPTALRDVEEGAVNLRRVGQTLAALKEEFPELQVKMRSMLRLEMDAVRFLKEEPQKMDSMLKRVKALTEALSSLRRCVSESSPAARGESVRVLEADQERSPHTSPKPQPRNRAPPGLPSTLAQPELVFAGPGSPVSTRRVKTTVIQAHQHSPPLTPTHGRDLPTVAKVSPRSREGSPALQKRPGGPDTVRSSEVHRSSVPEPSHTSDQVQTCVQDASRAPETAGRESPEGSPKRTSQVTEDLDQVLREARASLTKSTPETTEAEASPSSRRSPRTQVEKPRRPSVEKKPSPDPGHSSPSPPRRSQALSSGVAAGRTGEVLFTARKEAAGSQKDVGDKETSVVPQAKPPRQAPEVRPKPVDAPADHEAGRRFMKELQVTPETPSSTLPSEKGMFEVQPKTLPEAKVPGQNPSPTMNTKSKSHVEPPSGCLDYHSMTVASGGVYKSGQGSHQNEENKIVEHESKSNVMRTPKSEEPPSAVSKNDQVQNIEERLSQDKDGVSRVARTGDRATVRSIPENTILTTGTEIAAELEKCARSSSDLQTLQRPQASGVCVQESSPDRKQDPNADTDGNGKQPTQKLDLQHSEEEGSLSPDILDEGGSPPPPPPASKIALRLAKKKIRALSKEQDLDRVNVSGTQTTAALGKAVQPIGRVYDNQGFEDNDKQPFNDLQSDFKRLSTIFESEEDLDRIVSPESPVEEEDVEQVSLANISSGSKDISLPNRPQTDNSVDGNQDRSKPGKAVTKFKFKFPKSKLASIGLTIRSGKTEKKTPEVAVPKQEEVTTSDRKPESKKLSKKSGRFRIPGSKQNLSHDKLNGTSPDSSFTSEHVFKPKSHSQAEELSKTTSNSFDSLDESIKRLEISKDSFRRSSSSVAPFPAALPVSSSSDRARSSGKVRRQREGSPSKRPAPEIPTSPNSPKSKRVKPQPPN
ncbi:sickle tail protein homolog isoform X2 [Nerophis lumbriciformis]|uniref:sickle tail protein homolog isoform X2 n=1 Tax=Nerophis lumbriciformis TaxID=546530 RepID=UPI002ADF2FCC|nr:sickle tail protein homolog isoform X2 [Nerophis lumbriciformis]